MPTVSETTAVRRGEPRELYATNGIMPPVELQCTAFTSYCQRAM